MKNKKEVRDISYMIDRVKYNGDYNKLNKRDSKILEALFSTKHYRLPQLVKDYIIAYSREMGYCGEVAVSAMSEYLKNEGYIINSYLDCIFHPSYKYLELDQCTYYKTGVCKKDACQFVNASIIRQGSRK